MCRVALPLAQQGVMAAASARNAESGTEEPARTAEGVARALRGRWTPNARRGRSRLRRHALVGEIHPRIG